jgi:O-succinylbenzoic acid--CoA ligase
VDLIWINGKNYLLSDFINAPDKIKRLPTLEQDVISFIADWTSGKSKFELKTSGSTGKPKTAIITRDQMITSAEMTISFFNLRRGRKALLCLNPNYIAGIMMIVRSIIGELKLYVLSPSSNPLIHENLDYQFSLTALVPYQVAEIMKDPGSIANFLKIDNVLIGGADIPEDHVIKIQSYKNCVYQTFAMTETVSHIALKRLSGRNPSDVYEAFEEIEIGSDDRGCLTVKGAVTGNKKIITNDLIELVDDNKFRWKGRFDEVINTGGIKININSLEVKIGHIFTSHKIKNNFFISSGEDLRLGEKIILVIETEKALIDKKDILRLLKNDLLRYEVPKEIYTVEQFVLTETGKINRKVRLI